MKNITFRTFYNFVSDQLEDRSKGGTEIHLTPYMYKKHNNGKSTKVLDPNITSNMHLGLYNYAEKVIISGNSLYTENSSMVKFLFNPEDGEVMIYPEIQGNTDFNNPIELDIDANIFDLESGWTTKLEDKNTFNASEILAFLMLLLYDYAKEN